MRILISKRNFTKAERILCRILQENKIEFLTKQKVNNREVDFLIGNVVIELDGHSQKIEKNNDLAILGYIPLHFTNKEILDNRKVVLNEIKKYINVLNKT